MLFLAVCEEFDGLQGILDGPVIQRINQFDTAVNQRPVHVLQAQNLIGTQMIHVGMLLQKKQKIYITR